MDVGPLNIVPLSVSICLALRVEGTGGTPQEEFPVALGFSSMGNLRARFLCRAQSVHCLAPVALTASFMQLLWDTQLLQHQVPAMAAASSRSNSCNTQKPTPSKQQLPQALHLRYLEQNGSGKTISSTL